MRHVVIVGGGISGLSTAYYLNKAGIRPTLIEKEPQLGGVIRTEVIDGCLGRVTEAVLGAGGELVITADHGNIEEMRDPSGAPQTKHTTAQVPFVLIAPGHVGGHLRDGSLADVAPTICALMGIPAPASMTGRSLIVD